jgi:hypothetical protein
MYIVEREHIEIKWSRAAAQSLESQVLEDSQSRWRLPIAIGNKQLQQINK